MNRRSKACDIKKTVKDAVWERDGGLCVICGNADAAPNAHYISRAKGGLGVAQNIVTLCAEHHRLYDQSQCRGMLRKRLRTHLMECYQGWDESSLVYRKE